MGHRVALDCSGNGALMKPILWTLNGLIALAIPARAEEGCGKDIDCKGARLCVQRQCVDPEARPPPPPDEHASPAPNPGASTPRAPGIGAGEACSSGGGG